MARREPTVSIYKDTGPGGNGAFAIITTTTTPEEFLDAAAAALEQALAVTEGDHQYTLLGVLPKICAIWAKLSGYRGDGVAEQRILICGTPNPAAHMALVGGDHPYVADPEVTGNGLDPSA